MIGLDPISARPISSTGSGSGVGNADLYTAHCARVRPRYGAGFYYGTGIYYGEGQRENPGRPCAPMDHYQDECELATVAAVETDAVTVFTAEADQVPTFSADPVCG
jgi:hypothetical protein